MKRTLLLFGIFCAAFAVTALTGIAAAGSLVIVCLLSPVAL